MFYKLNYILFWSDHNCAILSSTLKEMCRQSRIFPRKFDADAGGSKHSITGRSEVNIKAVSAREERLAKGLQGAWENHIGSNILKYVSHYSFAPERKYKSHG